MRRALVLAPHPDDCDVIGVTLRRIQEAGGLVAVAVLTTGATGVDEGYAGAQSLEQRMLVRELEQKSACAFFQLPRERLAFLRLGHGGAQPLEVDDGATAAVTEQIARWTPDAIFLPHPNDSNDTHRRTFALTERSLREHPLPATLLLARDPKTAGMREDLVVTFGEDEAQWKRRLLRHHDSQQRRNLRTRGIGLDERILTDNAASAVAAHYEGKWAEVFEIRDSRNPH